MSLFLITGGIEAKNASSDDDDNDDDDLLPYDLDEEDDAGDVLKSPKYLRDCIEGLVTAEDPSKTEATLKNIEKIVSASLDDLEDVCVELVKVLLHLQDRYSTDRFYELRHNAMVSVTVRCPQQVSCYLTEEFFAPNYNLQQRLDMLNVLADTAQQLSSPSEIQKIRSVPRKYSFQQVSCSSFDQVVPDWQKIVQERIDKKTKRFAKGPTKPQPKPVANKFSSVAGYFFFPLMKNFDSKVNTLDLLGDDTLILGRLVYTLGIVMYSARETPMARNMGTALLEFAWALKYHEEPFVRQALIFAQAMVAVSVPSSTLLSDTPRELFELHDWLTTVVQTDTDADSVKAALQTLILLEELFKNQVFLHG
ncbi:PREDICTED: telomere length regulation protein TEL2 homolog [Acropora digitifera]|uniref:telomere length regulation protein TEL2 homolog n=1 Tax=Acropora digitifera TaxID=70779 RepID=UPI00077B18B6|nr:PREDICTED: telomere length regulation protein TEL2 homolog [Acropora digitifera]